MTYDVTIGIPVFRTEAYIRQALGSALAQTFPSIEFLVVDDGGNDGTMDIVKELQQTHPRGRHLRILTHEKNLGVAASRNDIIDQACGEYLYFMDSDDLITPHTIATLIGIVRKYQVQIAFGSYEKIEVSGRREVYQYPALHVSGPDELACFAYRKYAGIQASACNYLVSKSILRDSGLRFIDTSFWEDFVFTFDLVTLVASAALTPEITYTYCCHEGSLSHYQARTEISKQEILSNAKAIEHLKQTSRALYNKVYYPQRCLQIAKTDFYIACHILKRRKHIKPSVSWQELRTIVRHPATWHQIRHFKQARWPNLALYLLARLPSPLCVMAVWTIAKVKKLI